MKKNTFYFHFRSQSLISSFNRKIMKNNISEKFIQVFLLVSVILFPNVGLADELNTGDTAWMFTSTCLVLFMTIPWAGIVLWGVGAFKERAFDSDAMFYHSCFDEHPLGLIRL